MGLRLWWLNRQATRLAPPPPEPLSDDELRSLQEPETFSPLGIWLACLLMPLAGAYLHHRWKDRYPEHARLANRASWMCAGAWLLAFVLYRAIS